jgi:hypothetical protein
LTKHVGLVLGDQSVAPFPVGKFLNGLQ